MIKVLNAIENDLEYITLEDLIKISGYSYYHFHRIFLTLVGESLKKYIKRLRLEKAVNSMRIQKCSITKIAFESGYNSSSSFNKAFKGMFGVNPSDYKKTDKKNFKEYKMMNQLEYKILLP
jgi:AraC family transcriptional regulator